MCVIAGIALLGACGRGEGAADASHPADAPAGPPDAMSPADAALDASFDAGLTFGCAPQGDHVESADATNHASPEPTGQSISAGGAAFTINGCIDASHAELGTEVDGFVFGHRRIAGRNPPGDDHRAGSSARLDAALPF